MNYQKTKLSEKSEVSGRMQVFENSGSWQLMKDKAATNMLPASLHQKRLHGCDRSLGLTLSHFWEICSTERQVRMRNFHVPAIRILPHTTYTQHNNE
jgi:hypothetical protein